MSKLPRPRPRLIRHKNTIIRNSVLDKEFADFRHYYARDCGVLVEVVKSNSGNLALTLLYPSCFKGKEIDKVVSRFEFIFTKNEVHEK